MVERDALAAPASTVLHPGQGVPRDGRRAPPRRSTPPSSASRPARRRVNFAVTQAAQAEDRRRARRRHRGDVQGPQGRGVQRHRQPRRRPRRHRHGTPTARRRRSPARNVLLAAGSVPRLIPNFERGGPIMTSDEVLDLDHVPARVAVIGGGAIGCEFASTFADLGAKVTILEALPKILPGLDNDVANVVVRSFKKKKIDIRTGVMVTGHTPNDTRRHDRPLRRGREPRGRRRRRVGRPPAVRRRARPRRHRRQGRRARLRRRRRVLPHRRGRRVRHRRPDQHPAARPRRLRRGDPRRQADARRGRRCR